MKKLLKISALTASILTINSASAVPIFFPTTGHYYEYISSPLIWTAARTAALSMSHLGLPGYLATVTSVAENTFLTGLGATTGWLGGSDMAVEGDWRWMDGPEAGTQFWLGGPTSAFASWGPGEPNNLGGEDFLELSSGTWNDLGSGSRLGYFVEYSATTPLPDPIPVPATIALFGLGLLGLSTLRSKR
ncbi:PEP-CTERM sorting domain-containing protein [Zooshikella sp. RANM57]|uniref:PEP-CTERM sorting domain-containing protein n=1 Tax=Zooshikella sp. RANM57 TaxID=3425863 RepID=UPI003D70003E